MSWKPRPFRFRRRRPRPSREGRADGRELRLRRVSRPDPNRPAPSPASASTCLNASAQTHSLSRCSTDLRPPSLDPQSLATARPRQLRKIGWGRREHRRLRLLGTCSRSGGQLGRSRPRSPAWSLPALRREPEQGRPERRQLCLLGHQGRSRAEARNLGRGLIFRQVATKSERNRGLVTSLSGKGTEEMKSLRLRSSTNG